MRTHTRSRKLPVAAALLLTVSAAPARAQKAYDRLTAAAQVLQAVMSAPDGGIPNSILRHTQCVMIVPGYKKAGLGLGGELGRGVVSCRTGQGWSAPLFVSLGGASFGLQIGVEETDLVMLIMNKEGEDYLLKDKFSLGGDMAATAGPVGRDANAQTDLLMHAKMLAYSRSRGLFGGITIKGGVIKQDNDTNGLLYKGATPEAILNGKAPPPAQAEELLSELRQRAG